MTEKERISLGAQLTRSYSDNHRAPLQARLIVSSWGGELKQRFDTVLDKHHENWKGVTFMEEDFVAAAKRAKELMKEKRSRHLVGAFASTTKETKGNPEVSAVNPETVSGPEQVSSIPEAEPVYTQETDKEGPDARTHLVPPEERGEIVYLTSDSPYTLDRLKPYSTYIIGGLVDKNRHKGICYKTACDKGIKTAKLPIGDYMEMQSRFVLATNHVVEIMVRWLECGNWGEAFMKVMPKRKGGKLREAGSIENEEQDPDEINLDNAERGNNLNTSEDLRMVHERSMEDNALS